MGALKDGMTEIVLDKPRKLLFDLNVIEALNSEYGGYDKLGEILNEKNPGYIKDLKHIMALLMNEAAEYQNIAAGKEVEPIISEKFVGMLFNPSLLVSGDATAAIFKAFNTGTTGNTELPEDYDENPKKAATEQSLT